MKKRLKISLIMLFLGLGATSCLSDDEFNQLNVDLEENIESTVNEDDGGGDTGSGVGKNPPPPAD